MFIKALVSFHKKKFYSFKPYTVVSFFCEKNNSSSALLSLWRNFIKTYPFKFVIKMRKAKISIEDEPNQTDTTPTLEWVSLIYKFDSFLFGTNQKGDY